MHILRYIFLLPALCLSLYSVAQVADTGRQIPIINKTDDAGKKNGMWVMSEPERMGESAMMEFGNYDHGKKVGVWYKMDNSSGDLISIETYNRNTLDGEAKYFDMGHLICVGHYRGLNPDYPFDTIMVTNPVTGAETLRSVPSDRGSLKHGWWRYYDPKNGRLVKEEEYQVDDLIYKKEFTMSKEDSAYYKQRDAMLPHNTGVIYHPPARAHNVNYVH